MSVSVSLVPLALTLIFMRGEKWEKMEVEEGATELGPIKTIFNDTELLEKTLVDHGIKVDMKSQSRVTASVGNAEMIFSRANELDPFSVMVRGLCDANALLKEIHSIETEYQQNVQSYTYEKMITGLTEKNMTIAREHVTEDNSIVLTINVN